MSKFHDGTDMGLLLNGIPLHDIIEIFRSLDVNNLGHWICCVTIFIAVLGGYHFRHCEPTLIDILLLGEL